MPRYFIYLLRAQAFMEKKMRRSITELHPEITLIINSILLIYPSTYIIIYLNIVLFTYLIKQ